MTMNGRVLTGMMMALLVLPLLNTAAVAETSSASASASSDGPVRATVGTFIFEQGRSLALEIDREEPCSCLCEPVMIRCLRVLDEAGAPVSLKIRDRAVFPIIYNEWVGRVDLVHPAGEPTEVGLYTVVIDTSIGEFRAQIQVVSPGMASQAGRVSSRASVCGIELLVYRLFDEESDGESIALREGDLLLIALAGNPTTGYEWEIEEEPDDGLLERIPGIDYHPDSDLVGGGGTFYFRYRAVATGHGNLTFAYRRPWEAGPAEKTIAITIFVR
jgi:inhibitor of cysteine peptidase